MVVQSSVGYDSQPQLIEPQGTIQKIQPVEAEPLETLITENWKEIKSPMVGVFYQSSQPGKSPYVVKGQRFEEGDILCIMEAMKLMNEITAETSGTIMEICVGNGQVVEFGQVLFRVLED
jgi:acetyl-CoA carboxylase biotin carboxyl carrier protein